MLKRIPTSRALELIRRARQSPQSDPEMAYPRWYLHRWHFLPEGYLSRRGAAGYERVIRNLYNAGQEDVLVRKVVRRVRAVRPASVVELGCGPGRLLTALANAEAAPEIVGLDLSPYMLERAKARLQQGEARLLHADGLAVPANQGAFDVAVAAHYVGHLPGEIRAQAVHEITRIVRPGGRVIIAEHSWHPWPRDPLLVLRHASWHASRLIRLQVFERVDPVSREATA
ncbi:MAG: class I SAM-dependent methyltransferase [Dehalococcoidia bacterium]|nr:class I SAM-dependent methyltransferase [Dehalococcoidia bacterium]